MSQGFFLFEGKGFRIAVNNKVSCLTFRSHNSENLFHYPAGVQDDM